MKFGFLFRIFAHSNVVFMKYFVSVLALVLFVVGCSEPAADQMLLSGEIRGLKKGTIYLQKIQDTVFVSVDSLLVDGNSEFSFSEEITAPEVFYLAMTFRDSSNVVKRVPFFAEQGNMTLHTTLDNYETDVRVTGSVNHTKLDEYTRLMRRFNNQKLELIQEGLTALKDGDDSLATALQNKQQRLLKNTYLATVNFAINQNDYEVAPYIMLTEVYDLNVKYLDTVYTSLTPKIKDSKYGKALESFIEARRN